MVMGVAVVEVFAPSPDFRYVGLEPAQARKLGVMGAALGLGAGVALAMSGTGLRHAVFAGALASLMSALALRGAGGTIPAPGGARMGIVPWGVLVETDDETPRILRWAAVRRVDVETSRAFSLLAGTALSSRVVVETEHDRFVGEALGVVQLERLIEHLGAYAEEQSRPLALDLEGTRAAEVSEPECEALLSSAYGWLDTANASTKLSLPPAGYRRTCAMAPSTQAIEVLRRVLRDRTPKTSDPRAFAAVVAAEVHASALAPELIQLTQCPHPLVAAFARQAARKLGVALAKTGTLDELAPFLFEGERARLDAWVESRPI